jgi:hypothetical protein
MTNQNTNENLTVHFKVKDFNAWRTSYNGHEKDRVSAGITNSRVFRSADDLVGLERNEDGDGEERRHRRAQHSLRIVSHGEVAGA